MAPSPSPSTSQVTSPPISPDFWDGLDSPNVPDAPAAEWGDIVANHAGQQERAAARAREILARMEADERRWQRYEARLPGIYERQSERFKELKERILDAITARAQRENIFPPIEKMKLAVKNITERDLEDKPYGQVNQQLSGILRRINSPQS